MLRKIDQQFGRIARARQYAARPYEIVVLSDHGQTQGATFLQRNGYGLDELVERNLQGAGGRAAGLVEDLGAGDENDSAVSKAVREATGRKQKDEDKHQVGDRKVVVMGSGNLGADLPDGRAAPADAGGDRRAAPGPAAGAARASARGLAAGAVRRARRRGARRTRRATT